MSASVIFLSLVLSTTSNASPRTEVFACDSWMNFLQGYRDEMKLRDDPNSPTATKVSHLGMEGAFKQAIHKARFGIRLASKMFLYSSLILESTPAVPATAAERYKSIKGLEEFFSLPQDEQAYLLKVDSDFVSYLFKLLKKLEGALPQVTEVDLKDLDEKNIVHIVMKDRSSGKWLDVDAELDKEQSYTKVVVTDRFSKKKTTFSLNGSEVEKVTLQAEVGPPVNPRLEDREMSMEDFEMLIQSNRGDRFAKQRENRALAGLLSSVFHQDKILGKCDRSLATKKKNKPSKK